MAMTQSDPVFDRLLMAVIAIGVLIAAIAGYAIATADDPVLAVLPAESSPGMDVVMNEFSFDPPAITVAAGQTVDFNPQRRCRRV